jgi:hypothetical protein
MLLIFGIDTLNESRGPWERETERKTNIKPANARQHNKSS